MNLESYKQLLAELKKVRSDASKPKWIWVKQIFGWKSLDVEGKFDQQTGEPLHVIYARNDGLMAMCESDAKFIATAANEWDKLISDLESCVDALEFYQKESTDQQCCNMAVQVGEEEWSCCGEPVNMATLALTNLKLKGVE